MHNVCLLHELIGIRHLFEVSLAGLLCADLSHCKAKCLQWRLEFAKWLWILESLIFEAGLVFNIIVITGIKTGALMIVSPKLEGSST
jgi:hypothetical protein